MIAYNIAEDTIKKYMNEFLKLPSLENEEEFERVCSMQWAAEDVLRYLKEFWNDDFVLDLIADYIDEAHYRAEKYKDEAMGEVYKTAEETVREIALYFV